MTCRPRGAGDWPDALRPRRERRAVEEATSMAVFSYPGTARYNAEPGELASDHESGAWLRGQL